MPRPPRTWANIERKVMKYLGGERTHWAREDGRIDTSMGPVAVEVKHGEQIPKWVLKAWSQAKDNAGYSSVKATPLLVLHPPQWGVEECLVVLHMSDFVKLINEDHLENNNA